MLSAVLAVCAVTTITTASALAQEKPAPQKKHKAPADNVAKKFKVKVKGVEPGKKPPDVKVRAKRMQSNRDAERKLVRKWHKTCAKIDKGDPWGEIADHFESIIDKSELTTIATVMRSHVAAMRRAATQADSLPVFSADTTPQQLVQLLTECRLWTELSRDRNLYWNPLHSDFEPDGSRKMHWDRLGEVEEHEFTDPAVRVFNRGRKMIPHLIDALEDDTATRCTEYGLQYTKAGFLFRRSDIAITLIEAISRCKFYVADRSATFSLLDETARQSIIEDIKNWYDATSDMTPFDARLWLLERVDFAQAKPMIALLALDGYKSTAAEQLRRFFATETPEIQLDIARRLVALGDMSGLSQIVDRIVQERTLNANEAQFLIDSGGRREFLLLRQLVQESLVSDRKGAKSPCHVILRCAAERKERRMTLPLLACALNPEDDVMMPGSFRNKGLKLPKKPTRADLAASAIQAITGINFRYNAWSATTNRRRAIARVQEWWASEGQSLFGYDADAIRRVGGIR
jgi:hypothetical protein